MTTSDVERRLAALLHQRAEDAMNRTDTPTELQKFQARVERDKQDQDRRRAAISVAVVTAAAVSIAALWIGLRPDASPAPSNAPSLPTDSLSSAPPEPEQTAGSVVEGFAGVEGFPMSFVVPEGFSEAPVDTGTRGYTVDGTSGGAAVFLVSSLTEVRAEQLPTDLAAHIRETRDDIRVDDVRTTEVGGRAAQAFTLTQKPGTSPQDLWCVRKGSCFKLLEDEPMDVTVVRARQGLVLFEVEYLPRDRAAVQRPVTAWLDSVRWE